MRISSKGQVTVPKELRERAGIRPGEEVSFGFENGRITLGPAPAGQRPGPTRGERMVAALRGSATANLGVPTDELMKLLRGDD